MKKIIFTIILLSFITLSAYAQWTQLTSPASNSLYGICFTSASTGYLSGYTNGTIIKTTNGGSSWIFTGTGSSSSFYDINFINSSTGFAVGSSGQIFRTTNAGANWELRSSGSGTLYSIIIPSSIAYAGGGSPASFLKSSDYGINWTSMTPPTTYAIKGMSFNTGSLIWLCGDYGTLWRTNDGGTSWIPQFLSSSYMLEDIRFHSSTNGFVCGSMGIMRTTDGGSSWFSVYSSTTTLYDMHMINSVNGWAVGAGGKIVRTSNGGVNWYVQETPVTSSLYGIYMADANTGYAVGSGGVLLKTTNGGGVPALPYFQKITNDPVVNYISSSSQCSWVDFTDDGYQDLVVMPWNDQCWSCFYPIYMFKNNGNGTFTRVINNAIANQTINAIGGVWGDYDNDGKLDFFVTRLFNNNNMLFHNDGNGNFTQITTGPIVNDGGQSTGCAWCDYDKDGWIDLFVCNQNDQNNSLYHNNHDGTFTKITNGSIVNDGGWSRSCAWGDYDNDGWPDLFVVNYQGENDFLYHNNGNGTFTRITSGPEVNDGLWGSACCWADYDNDGTLDLYVTNNSANNQLYHNDGNGNFTLSNTAPSSDGGNSFSPNWADYNNDGWLDIFLSKHSTSNILYKNVNGNFTRVTNEIVANEGGVSEVGIWSDINNDGKVDLFVTNTYGSTPNYLYKNVGTTGNYITIKLIGGCTSNKAGIGARIKVYKGTYFAMREVNGGLGFGSQNMIWQHFGLGTNTSLDSIVVLWPSGIRQKLTNVSVNKKIVIDECTVGIQNPVIALEYKLAQNYPNPFNPTTTIEYSIIKSGNAKITVYDVNGRLVSTLINNNHNPGSYKVDFDGASLSSGIYIYKIETKEFTDSKKMILLK